MYTFQDFSNEKNKIVGINSAINAHLNSDEFKIAQSADNYNKQKNELISNYIQTIYTLTGIPVANFTASNNKLCSNFFHRLNVQRNTYLLGNGVSFTQHRSTSFDEQEGEEITIDETKQMLGDEFDTSIKELGFNSLIHGVCFGFWNVDKLYVFPLTEFVPLWDEETGALRAGIRFWRIDKNKPTMAVLYEEDGYTKYKSKSNIGMDFEEIVAKRSYKTIYQFSEEGGEEIIGEENYGTLPIIPFWGSSLHQSTLIGMKEKIDSFDLIQSGFANDLTDCAQIYWLLENCGGMSDSDIDRFRDRLLINHMAVVDSDNSRAVPYTQEVPYAARREYLNEIRSSIYEDFGGLDVHAVAAGATNDHIDAAYQPLDEEADDFEFQATKFIKQLLKLIDVEDDPTYKRNRISNQQEQTQMILSASDYLDEESILNKLPFVSVDEVSKIITRKTGEDMSKFGMSEVK